MTAISLVALPPAAGAAGGEAGEILPGVHVISGRFAPGVPADGNSLVFEAPDGLIVIDTGRDAEHAQDVIDLAGEAQAPIAAVITTHWHIDHVGGNALVRRTFPRARFYGGPPPREGMAGLPEDTAIPPPDELITTTGPRVIAGRPLLIGVADHAVTTSDLWIYDPRTRVLATGDLVTLPVPRFDSACPRGWQAALWRLSTLDFRLLIPGHGAPMSRRGFETYRRAFENLLARAGTDSIPRDALVEGWMRDAAPLIPAGEREGARMLLGGYIDTVLRATPDAGTNPCAE